MAQTFELEVATPERLLVREHVTEAQIPTRDGMIGVLPDHAALLSALGTGPLTFVTGGAKRQMVLSGGFLEIRDNFVRVLADRAELSEEIDVSRAEASLKRAKERLALPATAGVDVARALNSLKRAEARLAGAKTGR